MYRLAATLPSTMQQLLTRKRSLILSQCDRTSVALHKHLPVPACSEWCRPTACSMTCSMQRANSKSQIAVPVENVVFTCQRQDMLVNVMLRPFLLSDRMVHIVFR